MKSSLLLVGVILFPLVLLASGGSTEATGHHGPPKVIIFNALNFSILLGIIFYFAKDQIKDLFTERRAEYHRLANEAKKKKEELDNKVTDLNRLIDKLRATKNESLEQADFDSKKYYEKEMSKAKEMATSIIKDADDKLGADTAKLIEKLRMETLEKSFSKAEEDVPSFDQAQKLKVNEAFEQRLKGASI